MHCKFLKLKIIKLLNIKMIMDDMIDENVRIIILILVDGSIIILKMLSMRYNIVE